MQKLYGKGAIVLLVFLCTLLCSNKSFGAFVVRAAPTEETTAAPAAAASVEAEYNKVKTRLATQDYRLHNFSSRRAAFKLSEETAKTFAVIGSVCALAGVGGVIVAIGFDLVDEVIYISAAVAFVGLVFLALAITGRPKRDKWAVVSPKPNELGIAYKF